MEYSRFIRCIKSMFFGGFLGASVITGILSIFKPAFGLIDIFPGALSGAVVGLVPAVALPKHLSLPMNLSTFMCQLIGAFFIWILGDGLVKGAILHMPGKRTIVIGSTVTSWAEYPGEFVFISCIWAALGILSAGVPIFNCVRANHNASRNN
jgi:hypothetical protein